MRFRINPKLALVVGFTGLVLALAWGQDAKPTYVKQAMCIACHQAINKGLVERYQTTKHSQVKPEKGMEPVDIYRRCVGFNPADNSYYEAGVGCQDCHGPGSAHLMAQSIDQKKATMQLPDKLSKATQKLSLCGRCHGQYTVNGKPYAAGFVIGDDLFTMPGFKLAKITKPGPFQQLNDLETSQLPKNGVTCLTCHTAHGEMAGKPQLRKPVPELCTQCHKTPHQNAKQPVQIPAGATCVTCHMPGGRHTFVIPKQ